MTPTRSRSIHRRVAASCRIAATWSSSPLICSRPKMACAGCRGAHGGCRACRGLGFVPDDSDLLKRDEQLTYDLGDPFELAAESEGGAE